MDRESFVKAFTEALEKRRKADEEKQMSNRDSLREGPTKTGSPQKPSVPRPIGGPPSQKIEGWAKVPIWLIWSLHTNGSIALREVSTSESRVQCALKMVRHEHGIIRAWAEPRETNHCFGHRDVKYGVGDEIVREIEARQLPNAQGEPENV